MIGRLLKFIFLFGGRGRFIFCFFDCDCVNFFLCKGLLNVFNLEFLNICDDIVFFFIGLLILFKLFRDVKFLRLLNIRFDRIFFVSLFGFVNGFFVIFLI